MVMKKLFNNSAKVFFYDELVNQNSKIVTSVNEVKNTRNHNTNLIEDDGNQNTNS
jgi:hypothetical protein